MAVKFLSTNELLMGRVTPEMRESSEMLADDMFRDGKGFIGEIPVPKSSRFYSEQKRKVEEAYISQNVLLEICERKAGGVLGREPLWALLPEAAEDATDRQTALIEEAEAALTNWWNENEMLALLNESLEIAFPEQRAEIRPFVPSAYRDGDGNVEAVETLSDALNMLKFEVSSGDSAGVFRQKDTYRHYSIFKALRDDETWIDISFTDGDGLTHFRSMKETEANRFLKQELASFQKISLSADTEDSLDYLKNNFSSIAKYLDRSDSDYDGDGNTNSAPEPLDLKGKLFLYELDLKKPFISKSIRSLQKEINLAFTMKGRNINLAGSRERYFSNTRSPKQKTRVSDAAQPSGYREAVEDAPLYIGSGAANFLQGTYIRDENGKVTGIANPNVSITDPVAVTNFVDTIIAAYTAILAQAQQLHVMMNDSATASGKSRREARAEFEKSLKKLKAKIDALGRWIIEFALQFAAVMCGREDEFAEFRCNFDCIVDAGMPDAEERAANIEDYKEGVISLETLRSRNGVEDTGAEKSRIESEPAFEINLLDKILEVLGKANGKLPLKMQVEILAKALGKEESEVAGILAELENEKPVAEPQLKGNQ